MNQDKLKLYSVKVEGGSGCFFQPMSNEYTYILTAKHLFYEVDDRGKETGEYENGKEIEILKHKKTENSWKLEKIPFILEKGVNYFPHPTDDADIAILKVDFMHNFNSIFIKNVENDLDNFQLCGFPESRSGNYEGEKYDKQDVESFGATGNYCQGAQLFHTLQQRDIEGYSGCGILKEVGGNIYIRYSK